MPPKRRTIGRQHIGVQLDDGSTFDVWSMPIDESLRATTAQKHGWPAPTEDPIGYLGFLAWVAGRRSGAVRPDVKFEAWFATVLELEVLGTDPIRPTPPGPGPG